MTEPYNFQTLREMARRRLPRPVFDYLDGGAEDEATLQANRSAFAALRLRYVVHEDDAAVDLSTSLCGSPMSMPVLLAPVGSAGLFHPDGDLAAARVAARRGLMMVLSGNASYSIEEVGSAVDPKPWYQLYSYTNRDFYGNLIDRAATAGYRGLAVTIDTAVPGRRERDIANAFTPSAPRLTRQNAAEILTHPRWTAGVVSRRRVAVKLFSDAGRPSLATLVRDAKHSGRRVSGALQRVTWSELEWIRERWTGPLAVKGIVDPDDARRAADLGAEVIFVSNHGGRQLDAAVAALEALPAVVDAVGEHCEIVLDGGIRRGTDVIKALCLGARAVGVGRLWAFGLACGGTTGVDAAITRLRDELEVSMALLGQTRVTGLSRSYLVPAGVPGFSSARSVT